MNKKQHLNEEGLNKIISLKSSLNRGLSDELNLSFSIVKMKRIKVDLPSNIDYN
jgi:hypothetical protein